MPPVTTYFDGVSVTIGEGTDTWDWEPAAPEPTPTPEATPTPGAPGATPAITLPPTDVGGPETPWQAIDGRWLLVLGAVIAFALLSLRQFAYRRAR